MALSILFGGGGSEGYLNNGVLQASAAILLSLILASTTIGSWPLPRAASWVIALLVLLIAVLALQLMPLPPSLWHMAPGRELARDALVLIGAADSWRPISLDPEATRRAIATLMVPSAILLGSMGATRRELVLAIWVAVAATGVSALIGALQLVVGEVSWLSYYDGLSPGAASGVFANPNHQAALLVSSIVLVAVLIRLEGARKSGPPSRSHARPRVHPAWLALPFLAFAVVVTGSRAGFVLMIVAGSAAVLLALKRPSPVLWLAAAVASASVAGLALFFSPNGRAVALQQSFIFSDDARSTFLPDVLFTLGQYSPWGAGAGTFVQVFGPNENLDVAGAGYVNHAHNDVLEWLIETGALGAVWLILAIGVLVWRVTEVWRAQGRIRTSQATVVIGGALVLLMLGLASLVDFPLRMISIQAVAALAAAMMFNPLIDRPPRRGTIKHERWILAAGGVIGFLLGAQVLRIFAAEAAIRAGNGTFAHQIRQESSRAMALFAEQQLRAGSPLPAQQLATEAIKLAPLNARAMRVLAMTAPPRQSARAWQLASAMGWRDGPTQVWAFQQALITGEYDVAALRTDAFMRTRNRPPPEYVRLVRIAAGEGGYRNALLERLSLRPAWQASFFAVEPSASDEEIQGTYQVLQAAAPRLRASLLGEAEPTIMRLVERRKYDAAFSLYRHLRGNASLELLDDGGFNRTIDEYNSNSTPFDWFLAPRSGAAATVEGQENRFLYMQTDGRTSDTLLRRFLRLPAGAYRLTYRRRGQPESTQAIGVSLRCPDGTVMGSSSTENLTGTGFEGRQVVFRVKPDCPLVALTFDAHAAGIPAEAEFDDFSVKRLTR